MSSNNNWVFGYCKWMSDNSGRAHLCRIAAIFSIRATHIRHLCTSNNCICNDRPLSSHNKWLESCPPAFRIRLARQNHLFQRLAAVVCRHSRPAWLWLVRVSLNLESLVSPSHRMHLLRLHFRLMATLSQHVQSNHYPMDTTDHTICWSSQGDLCAGREKNINEMNDLNYFNGQCRLSSSANAILIKKQ